MKLGDWQVRTLLDARFALDGGSMFGVVPKALWERSNPPDERNRIALASRLLLLTGQERVVLVDTGLGDRWSAKERDIFAIEQQQGGVVGALRDKGLDPGDVTDVVLTHLHFDHAAGTVTGNEAGQLELTFGRARHHLQRRHWEWARAPSLKDRASFRPDDFELLRDSPRLRLHDGDVELFPGLGLRSLDGHTRGMQAVEVSGDDQTLLYAADLVPTTAHVRLPFIMAYDNQPLTTLAEKQEILPRAAEEGWILVFEHDPEVAAARLRMESGRVTLGAMVEL